MRIRCTAHGCTPAARLHWAVWGSPGHCDSTLSSLQHLSSSVACVFFPFDFDRLVLMFSYTLVLDMVFLSASPVCFFNLSLPFGFVNLYLRGHPQFSFVCGSKMNLFYFLVLQLQSCLHLASCLPHRLHTSWQHLVVFFWCENAIQGKKKKKVASSLDTSAETKVAAASTLSAHNSEKLFSWLCSAVFSAWSSCSFHHNYGAFHTLTSLSIKEADWLWV